MLLYENSSILYFISSNINRFILKILKYLEWDTAKDVYIIILYIIASIAIILFVIKVIVYIYKQHKKNLK